MKDPLFQIQGKYNQTPTSHLDFFKMQTLPIWYYFKNNMSPRGLAAHMSIAINTFDAISPLHPSPHGHIPRLIYIVSLRKMLMLAIFS